MASVLSKLLHPLSAPAVPAAEAPRSDEQWLVSACQQGDANAQQQLYLRYARRVWALVTRIAGSADAEEITQEVFLRALKGIHSFRGESQLGTWLYRLAVNAALTHATRSATHKRRQAGDEPLEELAAEPQPKGDPFLRERLRRAMDALPPGYRAVLVLHDVESLQHEEIAQILGVSVGTSKSQLHKARARMRELLEFG